jgi:hypothetical protein
MTNSSIITVVACGVFEPEIRHFAAGMAHIRELVFLPQGLHDDPARMQRELQAAIDRAEADPTVSVVVLAYGLCSRGVENLRHDRCPLVIARAHDCVTLFVGDKDRVAAIHRENPGTYWYHPGWIRGHASPGPDRDARLRREYAEKFGEDDVEYLMEMDRAGLAHYNRAAYVGLGLGDTQREAEYTRSCAACLGWGYQEVAGDPALLQALLRGDWDEKRFLIVPPRHVIRVTADDTIIRAEPAPASHQNQPAP